MAEFKSFDDFQKELHGANNDSPQIPEEKAVHKKPRHASKKNKMHVRKYVWSVIGSLLFVGSVLFFTPVSIGSIRIYGNETLTRGDILFDGNLTEPINVFQINTSDFEERLKQDVRIYRAEVNRSFPAYVDVHIAERKPIAVIQKDIGYAILDRDGMVIQTGTAIHGMDFPMITGVSLDNALLGDVITRESVKMALQFLGVLSIQGIQVFSEINIGNQDNIIAYTRDGIAIRLGDGSSIKERAELAENMVSDVKVRGLSVEYIDASLTSPYIKLKK